MDFGAKLKEIRKNEGLSQEQLADKIGVSRQAITKWETGRALPDMENMIILAEIFKTTLDELVSQAIPQYQKKKEVYTSETVYDIDCSKHFDIHFGAAQTIVICGGKDEKLHVKLESETMEDLHHVIKVKLDEHLRKSPAFIASAKAMRIGMNSGGHPAITPLTATCRTVTARCAGGITPISRSGARSVKRRIDHLVFAGWLH